MTTNPESNAPTAPVTARTAPMPVLPLRDIVVFPGMIVPLFVGREKSVKALEEVMKDDKQILLIAQKNASQDDPGPEDIRRAAADATVNGYNQYPSMMGIPELRTAIAEHYGRWHGLSLDPMTEVMVTVAKPATTIRGRISASMALTSASVSPTALAAS